ncbi:uncharacterized protein LOC143916177 isoform X1 [Arctopsyche grandis]|uniref:uncharacterized protein LOC143916177 isoform X1 n=1 Tax=Arctopsyche grandis TaxID=121162 RepID=UPI00406D6FC5
MCDHEKHVQYSVSFMEHMYDFYRSNMHCDFVIIFGTKRYEVHKLVLLISSEVFRNHLDKNLNEYEVKSTDGIREQTVEKTIHYLYNGTLDLAIHEVYNFLKLAEIWGIKELKNMCYSFLKTVTTNNDRVSSITKQIDKIFLLNFSEAIKDKKFLDLSVDELKALLQSDELQVSSEEDAFKGLALWVKKDFDVRKQHLKALMACIRLPLCSLTFLLNEVQSLWYDSLDVCKLLKHAIKWHQNPEQRSNLTSLNCNPRKKFEETVLILGADDFDEAGIIESYIPSTNKWSIYLNIDKRLRDFASVIFDNKLFIFGGETDDGITNMVWCIDLGNKELPPIQVSPMKEKRKRATAIVADSQIYIIGGYNGRNVLRNVEQYDPFSKTSKYVANMNRKRQFHATVIVKYVDSQIYVIGGHDGENELKDVEFYCSKAKKWTNINPMKSNRSQMAAVVLKDYIYTFGGYDGSTALNLIDRFDIKNPSWESFGTLNVPLKGHSAIVYNSKVICFGDQKSKAVIEYDTNTKECNILGKMPNERYFYKGLVIQVETKHESQMKTEDTIQCQVIPVENQVSVVESRCDAVEKLKQPPTVGYNYGDASSKINAMIEELDDDVSIRNQTVLIVGGIDNDTADLIEEYDPISNICNDFYNLNIKIKEFSSVVFGNNLFLVGGKYDDQVTDKAWSLNLDTKILKELHPMQHEMTNATATVFKGCLYVIGGIDSNDNPMNCVQKYNFDSETWSSVKSMNEKRFGHATTVIADYLYVIGGNDNENVLQSVEFYDSNKDTWIYAKSMKSFRENFAAVTFENSIYVIGGFDGESSVSSIERYDPDKNTWKSLNNFPYALKGHCAVLHDNEIICLEGGSVLKVQKYDHIYDNWKIVHSGRPNDRRYFTAVIKN